MTREPASTSLPWGKVFVALAVSLTAVVGWAAWAGLSARGDLVAVRDDLQALRGAGEPLESEQTRAVVAAAGERAERASDRLSAPGPALVAAVPVLGRSLAAERDVARAADAVLSAGDRLLPLVQGLDVTGGQVDLGALGGLAAALSASAEQVEGPLQALADTPLGATPTPVRDAVESARRELLPLGDLMRQAAAGLDAVQGLMGAGGPRTFVVGVMNNAELRGAGGYVSSFSVVQADGGRVRVGAFQDVNDVQATPAGAVRVPAPEDFSRRYGSYLADTTLWKNVAMSPHVPASAQVLCEVAKLRPGVPCDAVVLLDVRALASIMQIGGEVVLAGAPVSDEDLVRELLVEAYAGLDADTTAQADRRAALRTAADVGLSELLDSRLAAPAALRVLADASAGRHLAVWSNRPQEQSALYVAGLSGSAHPDGTDLSLVSLNQLSAGKLDYYLRREVDVDVVVGEQTALVEQRVRLALDHPDDLPAYVLGVRDGRLDHLVDLGMARAAQGVTLTRDGAPAAFELVEDDVGSTRAVALLSLRDGEKVEYVLRYRVPVQDGRYALTLLPQPLAKDAVLQVDVRAAEGLRLQDDGSTDGAAAYGGPFDTSRTIEVRAARPSWWEREVELP